MKLFIIILILGLLPSVSQGLERDKLLHAAGSFTGQVVCSAVLHEVTESKTGSNIACAAGMLALGSAIELGAFGNNTADIKDMGANAVGVSLGSLIVEWKF